MIVALPRWVLFDLGGVLVEIGGVEETIRAATAGQSGQDVWDAWLLSPAVRDLETGSIDPETFADRLVSELGLSVSPEDFLVDFGTWILGTYPDIPEILETLSARFSLACLSNTNAVHGPIMKRDLRLQKHLDRCFLSYQMGRAKPEAETFSYVVSELGCTPGEVLFIDDNRLNIEGARGAGLQAERAFGPEQLRAVLEDRGLL